MPHVQVLADIQTGNLNTVRAQNREHVAAAHGIALRRRTVILYRDDQLAEQIGQCASLAITERR